MFGMVTAQPRSCVVDSDCSTWRRGSVCNTQNGLCINPFLNGGCLAQRKAGWHKIRVCHSEDPPEAAQLGFCVPTTTTESDNDNDNNKNHNYNPAKEDAHSFWEQYSNLTTSSIHNNNNSSNQNTTAAIFRNNHKRIAYPELRLAAQNWESATFQSWLFQIVFMEILHVPVTLETGDPHARMDFYHADNPFEFGVGFPWDALKRARQQRGDCQSIARKNQNPHDEEYQSCAHFLSEIWIGHYKDVNQSLADGDIEQPVSSGLLGGAGWFIPRYTGERDPTLLSYLGLQGEENRRKLANTFLRPTTFYDYCTEVSPTNCTADEDGIATRPPNGPDEYDRMFIEGGVYQGHYRKTAENDCDTYPDTCTGHLADFPCGWSSAVEQQTHYLNISLRSSGPEPGSRGYTYQQMTDMWLAANATQSNLMMRWWTPEALHQRFVGTKAEFQLVTLPWPTQKCMEHRVSAAERCSSDPQVRMGDALGVCAEPTHNIRRALSTTVYPLSKNPNTPEALWSPAHELLTDLALTDLQIGEIFDYWYNNNNNNAEDEEGQYGLDPREATCRWLVDHFDLVKSMIPKTFPRVVEENDSIYNDPLQRVAIAMSSISMVVTILTVLGTIKLRHKPAVRHAQVEFLFLLLVGLLLVSVDSILWAIRPTDVICVAAMWLMNVGYTLELVPLIVKVAAINRLVEASRRLKRIQLSRRKLFEVVFALVFLVIVFMICWTVLDPPRRVAEYVLTDKVTFVGGETIVEAIYHCNSSAGGWRTASVFWHALLLLTATVLAFQTRNVRDEFNESRILAILIYSHFVFVLFRVSIFALEDSLGVWRSARFISLVVSCDVLATCGIYFCPKFCASDDQDRKFNASSVLQLRQNCNKLAQISVSGLSQELSIETFGGGGGGGAGGSGRLMNFVDDEHGMDSISSAMMIMTTTTRQQKSESLGNNSCSLLSISEEQQQQQQPPNSRLEECARTFAASRWNSVEGIKRSNVSEKELQDGDEEIIEQHFPLRDLRMRRTATTTTRIQSSFHHHDSDDDDDDDDDNTTTDENNSSYHNSYTKQSRSSSTTTTARIIKDGDDTLAESLSAETDDLVPRDNSAELLSASSSLEHANRSGPGYPFVQDLVGPTKQGLHANDNDNDDKKLVKKQMNYIIQGILQFL
ncbi:hypothetical protein ACA910_013917 [Epithemia clementina (nom. ined.)]